VVVVRQAIAAHWVDVRVIAAPRLPSRAPRASPYPTWSALSPSIARSEAAPKPPAGDSTLTSRILPYDRQCTHDSYSHHDHRRSSLAAMSTTNGESFFEPPPSPSNADDIDSLPSSSTNSSADDDEYISDAEREWRESLQQLELLLTMVVVPAMGKYFGRKCAYWGKC
jgi:hypothetical protein